MQCALDRLKHERQIGLTVGGGEAVVRRDGEVGPAPDAASNKGHKHGPILLGCLAIVRYRRRDTEVEPEARPHMLELERHSARGD